MGLGLNLTGRFHDDRDDPETWLERIRSWLEANAGEPLEAIRSGQDPRDRTAVLASLHPCAEDLHLTVPEPGLLVASAKTSGVGPGYHIYLCELLHRLGDDLGIAWDAPDNSTGDGDETGYFHTADTAALEAEFLAWLRGVVQLVADGLRDDYQWLMISMAIGHHYHHHGPLVTPTGPRGLDWVRTVALDPARGIDLFPWWPAGLGAPFFRGRALARMWRDVRWRAPLADDEGRLLMDVHLDLARAYRLDPSLDYPWREWSELMDHIESHFGYVESIGDELEPLVRQRAGARAVPPPDAAIGYRRRPVRVELTDGWSIEIPGELREEWDEDGLWTARDTGRIVFFRSYGLTKDDESKPSVAEILDGLPLPDGELFEHRDGAIVGRATLRAHDEEDELVWRLTGQTAVAGGLTVCHVVFRDPRERDWAVATWRSLAHS